MVVMFVHLKCVLLVTFLWLDKHRLLYMKTCDITWAAILRSLMLSKNLKQCRIMLRQFWKIAEKYLEADKPQYDSCRSLLRSGPAASLRVNIRAVSREYSFSIMSYLYSLSTFNVVLLQRCVLLWILELFSF